MIKLGYLSICGFFCFTISSLFSITINNTADLNTAIASGGTNTLGSSFTLTATLSNVTTNLTIDGAGFTINGNNIYQIFSVNGGTLSLSNMTLQNGLATEVVSGTLLVNQDVFGNGLKMSGSTSAVIQATTNVSLSTNINIINTQNFIQTGNLTVGISGNITGTGSFTKSGSGTLSLSGANQISGNITLAAGTTTIFGAGSLTQAASILVNSGAVFDISGSTITGGTILVQNLNGAGNIALGKNPLEAKYSSDLTISGVISGTGSFTKTGSNKLVLASANVFSGGVVLRQGTLQANLVNSIGSGPLTLNEGTTFVPNTSYNLPNIINIGIAPTAGATISVAGGLTSTFSGVIRDTGTGSDPAKLLLTGAGTINLAAENTFSGVLTINCNTLGALVSSCFGKGNVVINDGKTILLSGGITLPNTIDINTATSSGVILSVPTGNPASFLGVISGAGKIIKTGAGELLLNGDNTFTGGTTITLGLLGAGSNTAFGSGQVIIYNTAGIDFRPGITVSNAVSVANASGTAAVLNISTSASTLSGNITGAGGKIKKTGDGDLILGGTNTYNGVTDIFSGNLVLTNSVGSSDFITTQTGSGAIRPQLTIQGPITFGRKLTIDGVGTSGFIFSALNNLSVTGNFESASNNKLILSTATTATMTLTTSNPTFSGIMQINPGTVSITNENQLGASSSLLYLNGGTLAGTVSSITKTLTILTSSTILTGNLTISGVITGSNSLSLQSNTGSATTVTLSGNNTPFLGSLVLGTPTVAKILSVSAAENIGSTSQIVFNQGSILDFQGAVSTNAGLNFTGSGVIQKNTNNVTISGQLVGTGAMTITGNSTLRLSASNVGYSGNISLQSGTITFSNSNNGMGTGTYIPSNGVTLAPLGGMTLVNPFNLSSSGVNSTISILSGSASLTGAITGTAGNKLTKTGAGTIVLSGLNQGQNWTLDVNDGATRGSNLYYPTNLVIASIATAFYDVTSNQVDDLSSINLNGSGTFNKTGQGVLDLRQVPAGTFTGKYAVSEGLMNVNGNFSQNNFLIQSSGLLRGSGTTGTLTNNGFLRTGNSIGTLTVSGNYTQGANGDIEVEIDRFGNCDLLQVIPGTDPGDISLDGTVTVLQGSGYYPIGTRYRFLTYSGTRTGTFDLIVAPRNELFFLWYDNPTAKTIELEILSSHFVPPIDNADLTGYARDVASDLFCLPFPVDAPSLGLLGVLIPLVNLSPSAYREALVTIANGQISGITTLEAENNFRMIESAYLRWDRDGGRICYDYDGLNHTTFWVNPLGFGMWQNNYKDCSGYFADTFGLSAGAEYNFSEEGKVGFFGGYSQSKLHWKRGVGKTTLREAFFGPYIGAQTIGFTLAAALMGSVDAAKIQRNIFWSGFSAPAYSNPIIYNATGSIDVAKKFMLATPLYLEPQANIGVVQTIRPSFDEKQGSYFNTHIDRSYEATLRSCLRLNLGTNTCTQESFHGDMQVTVGAILTTLLSPNSLSSNFIQASEFCNDGLQLYGMQPSIFMFEAKAKAMLGYKENFKFGFDADYMIGDRSQVVQGTFYIEASF
jgi:autotransporter-associated beta strand protein